jgi:hypothetical protein
MRSVLIRGEIPASDLGGLMGGAGADLQASTAYAFGSTRVAIFVGKKFFFRSNDYLGVLVVSASDGSTQRVDLSYAGGGSGLLGVQLGAGTSIENSLFESLTGLAQSRNLTFQDVTAAPS